MNRKKFKTAILHFGADKTGSSSIQSACDKYRVLLEANGIYYPSGIWHNELASCVSAHPENEIANYVYGYTDIEWIKKRDASYLNNLSNEINGKEGKYLIFSNENFSFLDQKSIENLYEFALQFAEECKILIYVRFPEGYAISGISQRVKMGFDPWNPLPVSNVYDVLKALEKTCDKDQIVVRIFDRKMLYCGDVVADFLSFIELDSTLIESIYNNVPKENTSLSLEAKIIGEKIIHKVSGQKMTSLAFMEAFQNILESIKGQKIQLTQQQANQIREVSKRDTDYLKSEFGIIFPESKQYYPESIDSAISETTAESIAEMIIELVTPELVKGQKKEVMSSELQLRHTILREGYDITYAQAIQFDIEFALDRDIGELEAGIHIWDMQKRWAFGVNSTLQKQVMRDVAPGVYRISHYIIAELPEGVYTAGFAFTEKLPDGSSHELMWYDELCEFRVLHPSDRVGVGYANLPSMQMITQIEPLVKNLITDGMGCIVCDTAVSQMKPSEWIDFKVEINNNTDVDWRGDVFRPINLSYHWFDMCDNTVLFDGVRTSIPDGGISKYGSSLAIMKVIAPEMEGEYRLFLTLVQESVGWFEEMGFQPCVIEIKVNKD